MVGNVAPARQLRKSHRLEKLESCRPWYVEFCFWLIDGVRRQYDHHLLDDSPGSLANLFRNRLFIEFHMVFKTFRFHTVYLLVKFDGKRETVAHWPFSSVRAEN